MNDPALAERTIEAAAGAGAASSDLPEGALVARSEAASSDLPEGALVARSEAASSDLPEGVLVARVGAGANCSSAGSAIDILFYTSVIAGAIAVALAAAFPPRKAAPEGGAGGDGEPRGDDPRDEVR